MDERGIGPNESRDGLDVAITDRDEEQDRGAEPVGTRRSGRGECVGRHGQQLLESSASGERPLLGGRGADAEEGRKFGIGEVAEVVERDHRSLGFGQRLDRGPHVTLLVGIGDEHRGIARARVDHVDAVDRAHREPLPARAARARGADQGGEPAGEGVGVLEVAELAEREAERFLCGVGRAVPVTRTRHGHTDCEVLEAGNQFGPRRVLTALRGFDHRSQTRILAASCPCTSKEPRAPPSVTGRNAP